MTRRLVLVVSRHEERLAQHHAVIAEAGSWWVLPAPTVDRAAELLRKVRPALVLYDAAAGDGDGALPALHHTLHAALPHADTHLTVLGPVSPALEATLPRVAAADCAHCARCPHCGHAYPDAAGTALIALLGHILTSAVAADDDDGALTQAGDTRADSAPETPAAARNGKGAP